MSNRFYQDPTYAISYFVATFIWRLGALRNRAKVISLENMSSRPLQVITAVCMASCNQPFMPLRSTLSDENGFGLVKSVL